MHLWNRFSFREVKQPGKGQQSKTFLLDGDSWLVNMWKSFPSVLVLCNNQHWCVIVGTWCFRLSFSRYLQLVDHLIKQFSRFGAVGVFKVVLYTDLNHDGLQVPTNAYVSGRMIWASVLTYIGHKSTTWKEKELFFFSFFPSHERK